MSSTRDDAPHWTVADAHGRVLASRVPLRQLRARFANGLLSGATWIAREDDRRWRPLGDVLTADAREWFLMREGSALIGPLDAETVRAGIEFGKVPLDTWICRQGEPRWQPIELHPEFASAYIDGTATLSVQAPLPRWSLAS
jgi:hypothetical protein